MILNGSNNANNVNNDTITKIADDDNELRRRAAREQGPGS